METLKSTVVEKQPTEYQSDITGAIIQPEIIPYRYMEKLAVLK